MSKRLIRQKIFHKPICTPFSSPRERHPQLFLRKKFRKIFFRGFFFKNKQLCINKNALKNSKNLNS